LLVDVSRQASAFTQKADGGKVITKSIRVDVLIRLDVLGYQLLIFLILV
jgi:hypothetical protein